MMNIRTRDAMRKRGLCCRPVSIRPSEDIVKLLCRPVAPSFYFVIQSACTQFQGKPFSGGEKYTGVGKTL